MEKTGRPVIINRYIACLQESSDELALLILLLPLLAPPRLLLLLLLAVAAAAVAVMLMADAAALSYIRGKMVRDACLGLRGFISRYFLFFSHSVSAASSRAPVVQVRLVRWHGHSGVVYTFAAPFSSPHRRSKYNL